MKTKTPLIAAAIIALIIALFGLSTTTAQASVASADDKVASATQQKGWPGGTVDYWRHLGGNPTYIVFLCNDNNQYLSLFPGQWTKNQGGCADTDGFLVHQGTKLFCGERYGVTDYVYYPGWHNIGNFAYRACEMKYHAGSAKFAAKDITWGKSVQLAKSLRIKSLKDTSWGRYSLN